MKRINKKFIIFILILFISIGFAYLSATLNIAGLIGYKGNSWNIYFDNVQMIKNDVSADKPIINNSKDSVDFNISFSEPGEIYKFSVDVVNDGTIDAMIGEIIKTGVDSTNEDYIDYSVKYSNGEEVNVNDLLAHNRKVRLIVNVEYKYTTDRLAPENTGNYSLTLKYVQANDNARKVEELIESGNSNTFVLNNAKANSLSNLKIYGNTNQTQYSGKNLYNVNDYCLDDVCIGSGTTVDEDGWITISMDNTNGTRTVYSNYFTNNLDLVLGDTYTIVVEVKSVTGTGGLFYSSVLEQGTSNGQLGNHSFNLDKVKAGDIIIVSDVAAESGKWGLRTYGFWPVDQSGSITVRLSVIKGTGITTDNFVYEPYVGGIPSPNPDYPQDIHSVKDNQIAFYGKNLFDANNMLNGYFSNSNADVYGSAGGSHSDSPIYVDSNHRKLYVRVEAFSDIRLGRLWVLEYDKNMIGLSRTSFGIYDTTFSSGQTKYYSVNLKANTSYINFSVYSIETKQNDSYVGVYPVKDNIVENKYVNIMVSFDYTDTFESYHDNIYQLSLNDLELNKVEDADYIYNKDGDWYIKQKNNSIVYDGDSTIYNYSDNEGLFSMPLDVDNYSTTYYSTHALPATASSASTTIGSYTFDNTFRIRMPSSLATDKTTFKTWLTTNNIKVVSKKITDEDIKITDTTLINQLDSLITNNLFEGTNYITVMGSDLAPTIEFDYGK